MQSRHAYAALAGAMVLTMFLSDVALAERGEDSFYRPPTFGDLDFDRNDVLDRGEVQGRSPLSGQWSRFDSNGDGMIEPTEFAAFERYEGPTPTGIPAGPLDRSFLGSRRPGAGLASDPSFSDLDVDGDGVLSKAEAAGRKGLLDEWWPADKDKDNRIERSEFSAFEAVVP
jgi:hypothetical protein